jgi:hypothetical protein
LGQYGSSLGGDLGWFGAMVDSRGYDPSIDEVIACVGPIDTVEARGAGWTSLRERLLDRDVRRILNCIYRRHPRK